MKKLAGTTFQRWKQQLVNLGYEVDHRELVAADYGTPTTRKRFYLIARCDGQPIVWPERTHAPRDSEEVKAGKLLPWRSAAEIIDWSIPGYSVFASKAEIKEKYGVNAVRPLAENTMRRIIRGVDKFTIRSGKPFLVECNHGGDGHARPVSDPREHPDRGIHRGRVWTSHGSVDADEHIRFRWSLRRRTGGNSEDRGRRRSNAFGC